MGGIRTIAILLICAALCAIGLSACGGDDDSSTSPGATTPTGGGSETTSGAGDEGSGGETTTGGDSGSQGSAGSGDEGGGSGEKSAAFISPGGDNSIQEFGEEGDSTERSEAEAAIAAVGKAGRTGEWSEVCDSYLSATNLQQFEVLASKVPKFEGKTCSDILNGLNPGISAKDPSTPKEGVASIRTEGENAFAIYRGIDGNGYAYPFVNEDGKLKLTALAPTPLG